VVVRPGDKDGKASLAPYHRDQLFVGTVLEALVSCRRRVDNEQPDWVTLAMRPQEVSPQPDTTKSRTVNDDISIFEKAQVVALAIKRHVGECRWLCASLPKQLKRMPASADVGCSPSQMAT
jgi:hypothetical protein